MLVFTVPIKDVCAIMFEVFSIACSTMFALLSCLHAHCTCTGDPSCECVRLRVPHQGSAAGHDPEEGGKGGVCIITGWPGKIV